MSIATEQTNEACSGKELRDPSSFSFRINLSITAHDYKRPLKNISCSVINILTAKQDWTMGQSQTAFSEILSLEVSKTQGRKNCFRIYSIKPKSN